MGRRTAANPLGSIEPAARLPTDETQAARDQQPSLGLWHLAAAAAARAARVPLPFLVSAPGSGLLLARAANSRQRWRRDGSPLSISEGSVQAQRRRWPNSRRSRRIQQRGLKWHRRNLCRRPHRRTHLLFEPHHWWLRRRGRLLRNFFHAIRTARARRDLAVGNDRLAFLQLDSAPRPINLVTDAIRNVSRALQHQTHDARVVIIESRIVSRDYRIMFRRPLQLTCNLSLRRAQPSRDRRGDSPGCTELPAAPGPAYPEKLPRPAGPVPPQWKR